MSWDSLAVQLLVPSGVCLGFFFGFLWDLRCQTVQILEAVKDKKIRMLQQSLCRWHLCCPASAHDRLHEQKLMRQAAHLAVLACHYGCLCYKPMQKCHWSVQKQCGTCFLCHILRLLPFLPSPSILETKIEDRIYNVAAFYAGKRLEQGAEESTYGTRDMVSATEGRNDTVE